MRTKAELDPMATAGPQVAVSFILNTILWLLLGELEGWLTYLNVTLFLEGLLMLFPMIFLRGFPAMFLLATFALLQDAMSPAFFGIRFILYSAVFIIFHYSRERLRWDQGFRPTFAALLANTIIYIGLTITSPLSNLTEPYFWVRWLSDLGISTVVLAFSAVSYINLHKAILLNLGYRFWQSKETPA